MPRIDAHQHFWTFVQESYAWVDAKMTPIRRDFAPGDLEPELARAGIDGTVLVEARGHLNETDNLLAIAERTPFARGVVGWLPLSEPGVGRHIEQYASRPMLRGVRHWLGADDDAGAMFAPALHRGLGLLQGAGLVFDLGLRPPQLGRAAPRRSSIAIPSSASSSTTSPNRSSPGASSSPGARTFGSSRAGPTCIASCPGSPPRRTRRAGPAATSPLTWTWRWKRSRRGA